MVALPISEVASPRSSTIQRRISISWDSDLDGFENASCSCDEDDFEAVEYVHVIFAIFDRYSQVSACCVTRPSFCLTLLGFILKSTCGPIRRKKSLRKR